MSFAHVVATSETGYVRPKLHEIHDAGGGALAVRQGRHPVIEKLYTKPFVPNDVQMSQDTSFLLVTGPNCSGKSTVIKTTAHIVILAHAGCFVPARAASIPLMDQLFTRIGTSDDLESNVSTFLLEMKETA